MARCGLRQTQQIKGLELNPNIELAFGINARCLSTEFVNVSEGGHRKDKETKQTCQTESKNFRSAMKTEAKAKHIQSQQNQFK